MSLLSVAGAVCAWICLGQIPSEGVPPTPVSPPALAEPEEEEAPHSVSVGARLEVRGMDTRAEGRERALEGELARARIEAGYRYRKWLRLVVEGDFAERSPLRDAYARLGKKKLGVRLGQFKPPVSGVELDSSWNLPLGRRGILHSVLEEHMRFAGHRPGLQLEWAGGGALAPKVRAGLFQGSGADGGLLPSLGVYETNLAARTSMELGPVEVGLSGTLIGTQPYRSAALGRYWMTGLDALADTRVGTFGLRGWADVMYGLSFHGVYRLGQDARFAAGRLLVAGRYGGQAPAALYAELFGMAETVNFDLTAPGATLSGYVVGLNVGGWDRYRLTLQGEIRNVGPASPRISDGGNQLRERKVLLLQLGGALDHVWSF